MHYTHTHTHTHSSLKRPMSAIVSDALRVGVPFVGVYNVYLCNNIDINSNKIALTLLQVREINRKKSVLQVNIYLSNKIDINLNKIALTLLQERGVNRKRSLLQVNRTKSEPSRVNRTGSILQVNRSRSNPSLITSERFFHGFAYTEN